MGSKAGQKLVVVRKTEKLGEKERKALFPDPSEEKGHDDDDDDDSTMVHLNNVCLRIVKVRRRAAWKKSGLLFQLSCLVKPL